MKYYGKIGFAETIEVKPDVWKSNIVERSYYGDWSRKAYKVQPSADKLNDDILIANELSILADPYANENWVYMKYVTFKGAKWKITNVDVSTFPRMTLTLGGLYNGN